MYERVSGGRKSGRWESGGRTCIGQLGVNPVCGMLKGIGRESGRRECRGRRRAGVWLVLMGQIMSMGNINMGQTARVHIKY